MRLKSIDIKGFKSFANETVIHFDHDVIAIVGPNGSGKSNIVDAIRWVLGEQKSKELRLDSMSNVLFNGTKKRKEAPVAQVSLQFENTKNILNTDFQNITIARMLYRSGDSEYRLNGVTCRLKDINNLFMDTGVGSNTYAIISLSMVDDILTDKEKARRRMFEQAAGITKFKNRKAESLQKLEHTQADLDRVQDILFELESNLKMLEKQAKRTQKYVELKEEYKKMSILYAAHHVKSLDSSIRMVQAQLKAEEHNLRGIETIILKEEADIEAFKKYILEKETLLSEQQKGLNSLVATLRTLESEKNLLAQKAHFTEQNRQKSEEIIRHLSQTIAFSQSDIQNLQQNISVEKEIEQALFQQLSEKKLHLEEKRNTHSNLQKEVKEYLDFIKKDETELLELDKRKAVLQHALQNLENEQKINQQGIADFEKNTTLLEQEEQHLKQQLSVSETALKEVEEKESKRLEIMRLTTAQLESHQKEIADVRRNCDAKRHEYNLSKSLFESMEGFPASIKYLTKESKWSAKSPLLSDVFDCKDQYRVAIENYLEPYLSHYVVNNRQEALEGISLLAENQKGRASFLIKNGNGTARQKIALEYAVAAMDVVEVEKGYESILHDLLSDIWLVKNEQLLPDSLPENSVFLTVDGQKIISKKRLSGGSVGHFDGKRTGRKKQMEDLKEALVELEKIERQLQEEIGKLNTQKAALQKEDHTVPINQHKKEHQNLSLQFVSLQTKMESQQQSLNLLSIKIQQNQERIRTFQEELGSLEPKYNSILKDITTQRERLVAQDEAFKNISDELGKLSAQYNDVNIQFIRQQGKVQAFEKDISVKSAHIQENERQLHHNTTQSENYVKELEQITLKQQELEASVLQMIGEKKSKETSLNEVEQGYFSSKSQLFEKEDVLRKKSRQRNDVQSIVLQHTDKLHQLQYDHRAIKERLEIEFSTDISTIDLETIEPIAHLESFKEQLQKAKLKIDTYGEINPMAIEAFKEIEERYLTILKQKEDIEAAKTTLNNTIKELETTASQQFMQAFEAVRMHFIHIFRSLFTEDDSCDLILEDPENPLDTGIQIIAKPKGKRPQTIQQLSGGEKTLTATALLFALYLLKPAPFCIFDEVDAPLDDANIEKFNTLIRKFSSDSQFVIITHNKATMAAVDIIYGVYMPEDGVSAVTPVDFRNYEHNSVLVTKGKK